MVRRSTLQPKLTLCSAANARPPRRLAFTLAELLVVLLVVSILLGLAVARIGGAADRAAVRAAAGDAASVLSAARTAAIHRRGVVSVALDTTKGTLITRAEGVLLLRRDLLATFGVRFSASRESTAFDPRGLGLGAANLSIVIRRGRAVDTVFLSRLGRVRR